MAITTLDRTPPPFFKQGPSAFTRLLFFSSVAIFMMVADVRFKVTQPLRAVVATALHPVELALLAPLRWRDQAGHYLSGLDEALVARQAADKRAAQQSERVMRAEQLEAENAQLRALLDLRPRVNVQSLSAEVLYDAPDPYTRKVVLDRGSNHGVAMGAPVIDQTGVLGQVTRVYPLTSEVTLVTDRDAAVPVINSRSKQRGAAYGLPTAQGMELRFMAGNADVQVGDQLITSGLDGVYPADLPVAKVIKVDRRADSAFARILLAPMAKPDNPRHVLVLRPLSEQLPTRPTEPAASSAGDRASLASQPASRDPLSAPLPEGGRAP
jgi:rod shape-determining protein MreC